MLRKLIPGKNGRNGSSSGSAEEEAVESPPAAAPQSDAPSTTASEIEAVSLNDGSSDAEAAEAEAGQRATPPASPPAAATLASHPVTPSRSNYVSPTVGSSPAASSTGGGRGQASPGGGSGDGQGTTEFRSHLRKVTASLVDILDQISTTSGGSTSGASQPGSSWYGSHMRRQSMASKADPIATAVDVEAGAAAGGSGAPGPVVVEEMVPAHHVRRLTTTIVDMLRSMTAAAGSGGQGTGAGAGDPAAPGEGAGLLWDTASELSLESDKLSIMSDGATGTSGPSAKDSEISAATALLKAQYLPQPEYRGDEVRPFYIDRAGAAAEAKRAGAEGFKPALEAALAAEDAADFPVPPKLKKRVAINWLGLFVYIMYISVFVGYVVLRAMKTLGLGGSLWYGIVVLIIEILGGIAMLPYGLCLTVRVAHPPGVASTGAAAGGSGAPGAPPAPTAIPYHIRVVIPCYKEPLDVISKTFMAALYAALPPNCRRTVYLLDDGKDPDKRRFVRSLGTPAAVYISGRKRAKGEMNGKSANINNAARLIYPPDAPIPVDEVMCVFDADQVPNADFFTKTVPLLDGGRDVAMVLSPQTFYNLNPDGDIFNHANVAFWDYTQPGYDALGLISCTGTNFLLRARAFADAGLFPEWTLTEDFALGIELKRRGWQCRYVDEYLAVGEAPEEVRNCFQQRSRWAKGHFQVFFGRGRNPILGRGARGLSLLMRWMYGSVVLSYFSAFLGTPLLMLVPIITVWFGAFPIVINFWAAVTITAYYAATLALMYYTRAFAHLKSMWFTSVSNSILWFAFLKAMYRATVGRWLSGTIVFKVTAKGLQRLNNLPLRDVWMATLWFVFSLVTLIFGLVHFFRGGVLDTPLAISLIFMVYNLIPQYLLLQYAAFRPRLFFNLVCKAMMLLSTSMMILGVVLVWVLYPKSYDYKAALSSSLYFMDTQRVGTLPADFRVPFRKSAFETEVTTFVYLATNPNDTSLGGLYDGFGFGPGLDGFGDYGAFGGARDPFGGGGGGFSPRSPFGQSPAFGNDPFGRRRLLQAALDGGGMVDPFAASEATSPATATVQATPDPFGPSLTPRTGAPPDPFAPAAPGTGGAPTAPDPFAPVPPTDPFTGSEELPTPGFNDTAGEDAPLATEGAWDLSGGWISGMAAGNMKATSSAAFTTTLLAWGYTAFPQGFKEAGQTASVLDSVRWGADYLSKVYRSDPAKNTSLLVTRVGDVDTEVMLWYRPEDGATRPAYAVDLNAPIAGGLSPPAGGDLGGSVAAALAAASTVFRSSDEPYADALLERAKEVYAAAAPAEGRFTDADFNMTLLYNSSTVYDDMAWAAGWLFKATQDDSYMGDLYDYYVKHMEAEGEIADWKYAFDWDNVFWPVNVLMAQETGKGTFKKQSEQFLRSWMCANNAANYTQRGRAFNPMSAPLGATANAALAALMYADIAAAESVSAADTYRCWALSQLRYMLGDAGRSLVVGFGKNPPRRTQDRAAACPEAPAVCNRVTGLLSPDPDTHELRGALMYGPGKSDNYMDVRTNDASRVGVENNAGFVGALAGAVLLPEGMWEVCLQQFGIYRSDPVCGEFVAV